MTKLVRRIRVSLLVGFAILVVSYQAVRSAIAEMEREELVGEKNTPDERINSYERIVHSNIVLIRGDRVSWEIIVRKMTSG